MVRRRLFEECASLLEKSGIEDARFDTSCIFEDVLEERHPLFSPQEEVPPEKEQIIRSLIERRSEGYPLQYLLGKWEFFGYPFAVGEGVLIPRPDTETVCELALEICRREELGSPKIADLCSGSGCLAVTLKKELPEAQVTAVELSERALPFLKENIKLNSADVRIVQGDVTDPVLAAELTGLDMIVSNPPYLTAEEMASLQTEVSYEPAMALDGGRDGLEFYRAIAKIWRSSLKEGGWICFELGDKQHADVGKILAENGFENITFRRDLAGIVRGAAAKRSGGPNYGKEGTC
ncbi:MAG: peptide chain release factor N(5)-glutamine methyltransferase [Ruminococcus sp.]|nr:peptide chain release factor N(5)-glutamine methyltransferase [Ruminococcus sp.]